MKAQPSSALVLLVVANLVGAPVAGQGEAAAADGKGEWYEAEWKTRTALDPDYEVIQLTTDDAVDNKMYLDVNPYVPALDVIVFNSDRSDDDENLFLMSLDDGSFVQLTDADGIDGDHANVSPETQEAFYTERQTSA